MGLACIRMDDLIGEVLLGLQENHSYAGFNANDYHAVDDVSEHFPNI